MVIGLIVEPAGDRLAHTASQKAPGSGAPSYLGLSFGRTCPRRPVTPALRFLTRLTLARLAWLRQVLGRVWLAGLDVCYNRRSLLIVI